MDNNNYNINNQLNSDNIMPLAAFNVASYADLITALSSADTNIDITVTASFDMTGTATIPAGKIVTITSDAGGPYTLTRDVGVPGDLFTVLNTSSLTLSNIILDGNKSMAVASGALILNQGTLTLNDGAVVQNNQRLFGGGASGVYNDTSGMFTMNAGSVITENGDDEIGGVYNAGTFDMLGGTISNNHVGGSFGGVYNDSSGTFTMSDGLITGNGAGGASGGVYNAGTFDMLGGTISNNGVGAVGGGVYNDSGGTFTMNDGLITGNSAGDSGGGVYNAGTFDMLGGTISNNGVGFEGGGVYNDSNATFTMNDGLITGSSAGANGGGVYNAGTFDMIGGTISNSQVGFEGSGVYNDSGGTFTMSPDAVITENSANTAGGVYNNGTFDMLGGTISNNGANTGGGVFNDGGGTFTMNDGFITANTAGDSGGGVYNAGTFDMTGGTINDNNTGNNGGGVYNSNGFNMTGGTISGNSANTGGGVFNDGSGTFTMNDGLITTNTASSGGGVFTDGILDILGGTISNNTADNGGGIYKSNDGSLTISGTDTTITGNTANVNGGGIYIQGFSDTAPDVNISGNTVLSNNTAPNGDGGAIYIPYADLDRLNVGENVIFSNNSASQAYQINPADIPLHEAHILTDTFTVPFQYGYNNYDISYTNGEPFIFPVDVTLQANKTAVGAPLVDGQFEFGVFDENNNLIVTAFNDANGNIMFPPIQFGQAGVFQYTIREITPSGGGWTVDSSIYPVTITVTDNGEGQYVAQVDYPSGMPNFVNTYSAAPATVNIAALKQLVGWTGGEVQFEFGLFDENNALVETAQNQNGVVEFPPIVFTEAGVFQYTIREITPSGGGWTVDSSVYPVTVTVVDNGQGQLIAQVDYPSGPPIFVDTYSAAPATVNIAALKQLVGWTGGEVQFEFGLFDENNALVEIAQNQNGVVEFPPIVFTEAGVFQYTIREITPSGGGWTVDSSVYPVTVTVVDNGQGQLIAQVDYPSGPPIFVDTYSAAPAVVNITALKQLVGWTGGEVQFEFGLFDENNTLVETAQNQNGIVEFPSIVFTEAGVFQYTIREITPSGGGWTVDSSVYPVIITVTDDGEGNLVAQVQYPSGPPIFVDTYSAAPVVVDITAIKQLVGWTGGEIQFQFGLFDENNNLVETAQNQNGVVEFPSIVFTEAGVFKYTIRELTPSGNCWVTDCHIYQVIVTVTDNLQGQLVASISYEGGTPPTFVNKYCQPCQPCCCCGSKCYKPCDCGYMCCYKSGDKWQLKFIKNK